MIDILQIKNMIKNEDIVLLSDAQLSRYLSNIVVKYCNTYNIKVDLDDIKLMSQKIFNEYRGLGRLEDFLEDDLINEIMINGYDKIFIEKKGKIIKSKIAFNDKKDYDRIIQKMVSDAGREVNASNPIVNLALADGSRVNIVLPPISKDEPTVTIRKFSKGNITMQDLINSKTLNSTVADFLEKLIKAKYNIIIGGGTSSGKTTFLNALSEYIPINERIITIEDARELKLINKSNLISLETRNINFSNKRKIDLKELIKNSLRMRPDRIIVGEVRADETLDMLQAMNTGHEGSLTTAHANSTEDMISRLETMVLRSGEDIPLEAIKRMIASSIEIIIHLKRIGSDKRRVTEISEIFADKNQNTKINLLYKYNYELDKLIKLNDLIFNEKLEQLNER